MTEQNTEDTHPEAPPEAPEAPPEASTEDNDSNDQPGLDQASEDELRAEIARLRRENAKDRTAARDNAAKEAQDELITKLAGALGINQEGEQPSADDLAAQLEASQQKQRQQAVEFKAWQQADSLGVDGKTLLNQVSFREAIADLDPESDTFETDLKSAIEEEKKQSAFLVKTPSRSSSQLNQHKGSDGEGNSSKTPEELAASITNRNPY